jgi:hypothetical protein
MKPSQRGCWKRRENPRSAQVPLEQTARRLVLVRGHAAHLSHSEPRRQEAQALLAANPALIYAASGPSKSSTRLSIASVFLCAEVFAPGKQRLVETSIID